MDPEDQLLPSEFNELKQRDVFDLFDKDGNGHICATELGKILRALGQNPTEQEVHDALRKADKDGDQVIQYDEYVDMLKDFRKDRHTFEKELRKAFKKFDQDDNDDLNFRELRRALTSVGEPLTEAEATELCKMMDADGDKKVSVDEFVKYMLQDYDEVPTAQDQCIS